MQIMYLLYQHNKISKKKIQQFNKVIIKMGAHIDVNKLVIIAEPKAVPFDLSEDVGSNF